MPMFEFIGFPSPPVLFFATMVVFTHSSIAQIKFPIPMKADGKEQRRRR
jgi:hypothetical protein